MRICITTKHIENVKNVILWKKVSYNRFALSPRFVARLTCTYMKSDLRLCTGLRASNFHWIPPKLIMDSSKNGSEGIRQGFLTV
jgi:hypothetical protein